MSSLEDYDLLENKPQLGPVNPAKRDKVGLNSVTINKPTLIKTVSATTKQDTDSEFCEGTEVSLNKHGRWIVINKPWLLRDDSSSDDFRVVKHVINNRDKLFRLNEDVVSVYSYNCDEETTISTKKQATSLANLTYSPREKGTNRQGKQKIADFEKKKKAEILDDCSVQYDVFVAHSNPAMLKNRSGKGPKTAGKRRNKDCSSQLDEYYNDLYDEDYEDDESDFNKESTSRTSSTTQIVNKSAANTIVKKKSEEGVSLSDEEIQQIKNGLTHNLKRLYFPECKDPCVEIIVYRYSIYTAQDDLLANSVLPLKRYQLHIAKRDEADVDKMMNRLQRQMFRMMNSKFSLVDKYVKLSDAKDDIEILQHFNCDGIFLVRILAKDLTADKKSILQHEVTNKEIEEFLAQDQQDDAVDSKRAFHDFYRYSEIIVQEKWKLQDLRQQIAPVVRFLKERFYTSKTFPNDNATYQEEATEEIIKAVEKTAHLMPMAVCISTNTKDIALEIVVKRNWRQADQSIVYQRKLTKFKYSHFYYAQNNVILFSVQFILPFESL